MKHKNTQPSYIFNSENLQNSEPQNGPRRGLDFIALHFIKLDPTKGPSKYYVRTEVGGWGQKMAIFADVGRWVGLKSQKHADVILE